jgi:hypothetical protein
MANTSGVVWGVEVYRAVIFPLNSDGSPKLSNTTVYEGLEIKGPRVFELTPAEPRVVNNPGAGRIQDTIYLPPNEATRAELRVGYNQQAVKAALSGVKNPAVGEATYVMRGTEQQGNEPDCSMFVFQMAKDGSKLSRWHFYMLPLCKAIPMDSPMNENALEDRYLITMSPASKHIWGVPFTNAVEGCTEAAYGDGMSEGRPNIVMWKTDGAAVDFSFPVDKPATNVSKIALFDWALGTEVTAGITKAVDKITYSVAPTTGKILVAKYEY